MRSSTKIGAALVASVLFACPPLSLRAQAPRNTDTPAGTAARAPKVNAEAERLNKILDELSEEERQRFRSAVNEVWQAEEVEKRRRAMQEANLAYRKALQAEIGKLDASQRVRSVLMRLLRSRFHQETKANDSANSKAQDRPGRQPAGRVVYTEAERKLIDAARVKAEKTPAVIAVKLRVAKAVTSREKNLASGEYRQVMRAAMEAADPRVKALFAKRERDVRPRLTPGARSDRRRPVDEE